MGKLKQVPLKILVGKGIKAIRDSGRKDLEPYVDKLNIAKEKEDYPAVAQILTDLVTMLNANRNKALKV
jgi:hypothetical protein